MTIIDKSKNALLNNFGHKVRTLRKKKGILLRQVAAYLEIDTALISKIEKGKRKASQEQVFKIAKFLSADKNELIKLWLSDKIYAIANENNSVAEEAIKYVLKKIKNS